MKAVVLSGYGDVDKLELREMPDPHAAAGAIVVRMAGAGINPIDLKMRSGDAKDLFPVTFPAILGRDVAGKVVEVGAGVTSFAVGDSVPIYFDPNRIHFFDRGELGKSLVERR